MAEIAPIERRRTDRPGPTVFGANMSTNICLWAEGRTSTHRFGSPDALSNNPLRHRRMTR
jgi:hypothetical protein